MYRVSTPTHVFRLPFDTETIENLLITYTQDISRCEKEETILSKDYESVSLVGNEIRLELSQEETKKFKPGMASVQLRILTKTGKCFNSKKREFPVKEVSDDRILSPR